ncbi:MAG: rRNA adenine dimethyltransferase family protein [Candidatus ainarchaeum sp.]|nr:rRNA adenine dimethyltransferase family protein [Candidatus ainarchaeum sp.]
MGLEELQDLMIKYHFKPDKKLSQNFCTNQAVLIYMTKIANLKSTDVVLEIGPGTGFLTKFLVDKCKVIAVEKDEVMVEVLKDKFKSEIEKGQLILLNEDALLIDYTKYKINKVVSLPPYHISTNLLNKITLENITQAVLMLDEGFIEKLTAFEGLKEYTALTCFVNVNAKIEVVEKIAKTNFYPAPNCTSAIVNITFKQKNNTKAYQTFLKELFRHKNKVMRTGLRQALPFLITELKWKKSIEKKFDTLKNKNEKIYSSSPEKILKTYEELIKK